MNQNFYVLGATSVAMLSRELRAVEWQMRVRVL